VEECGTGPIMIHPKMEPNATGKVAPTDTRLPSRTCVKMSAPNNRSITPGTENDGPANANFSATPRDNECRGISTVIDGNTYALTGNMGSSANQGWTLKLTIP